jgi:hypothetical protein
MLNTLSTRPANLAALDLNLLVVFDAVLAEHHISRAALRLGKASQQSAERWPAYARS